MSYQDITQSDLKKLLRYDPETGVFTWLVQRGGTASVGSVAGSRHRMGYRAITVYDHRCLAHRLAWLYMTGIWPPDQIDHRNRVRDDNRWKNLRAVTNGQNNQNSKPRGISKYKGVSWGKSNKKWQAQVTLNGEHHHLGYFDTEIAAAAEYATFATKNFPEFSRFAP